METVKSYIVKMD